MIKKYVEEMDTESLLSLYPETEKYNQEGYASTKSQLRTVLNSLGMKESDKNLDFLADSLMMELAKRFYKEKRQS